MNIKLNPNYMALAILSCCLSVSTVNATGLSLVTMDQDKTATGNAINSTVLSANGRYVIFTTPDSLTENDTNDGKWDIYQRDLLTNKVSLISLNEEHYESANDNSGSPKLTSNGQYVLFLSTATDLVGNSVSGMNIYVHDLKTKVTKLVNANRSGRARGTNNQGFYEISDNGRYVVFESNASDLVINDTNSATDLFVRDLKTGKTKLITLNEAQTRSATGASNGLQISADGRFVLFKSNAVDLTAEDRNSEDDVFVHDITTNKTILLAGAGKNSYKAILKGRTVVFESSANNLVANDTNNDRDLFVRDLVTNQTQLVSVNNTGKASGNGDYFFEPNLSKNGRYVVFQSSKDNLVANDTNKHLDVFARDLVTKQTTLISANSTRKASGNADSFCTNASCLISDDGHTLIFSSLANDLTKEIDTNHATDLFVHDMNTKKTRLVSVDKTGKALTYDDPLDAPDLSDLQLSKDGRYLVFDSINSSFVAKDTNGISDVFLRDLKTGLTKLISMDKTGTTSGKGFSQLPVLSGDGKALFFISNAANLVSNQDTNKSYDIFAYKIQ